MTGHRDNLSSLFPSSSLCRVRARVVRRDLNEYRILSCIPQPSLRWFFDIPTIRVSRPLKMSHISFHPVIPSFGRGAFFVLGFFSQAVPVLIYSPPLPRLSHRGQTRGVHEGLFLSDFTPFDARSLPPRARYVATDWLSPISFPGAVFPPRPLLSQITKLLVDVPNERNLHSV